MGRIVNFLKSRRFVITVGLVFLVVLIWLVLGLWLGLGALICLIATCIVLVLFSGYLILNQTRAAKNASNLERSIWEQSEEQKSGVRPERREEIENLRQQLVGSIQKLKKSKLGQGRTGAAALYALPWYMIIGPPAAGKTTAIRNSGLEFPFGTDREIQGVGGTRNCDWWFSNSAIILDTAGRYITEEEDQEEWLAFLDVLKKNRRRQPINGVLVCISIADLLNASNEDMEWHAKTIRKRIDELTQRLGLRYPVYLVFTKCDLFNGFVEFFEDLSRTQREQIWGCTFNKEQLDDPNPKAIFEKEYQVLYDGLLSARFARLSPGIKREDRGVIFAFPMEFLSAKEKLAFFVSRVFQPNPYQESPTFRGFYFTSGTQEGVPIDRVIQSMAHAFGLAPQARQQFNPEIQAKSYFIRDLFTEVIIPDERLVRPNSRAAKNRRLFKVGAIAAGVLGLAIFILGTSQAYFRSKAEIETTANDVTIFKESASNTTDPLPRLTVLLNRMGILQDPPFFMFGMDKSQSLLSPMRKLYFRQLRPLAQTQFLNQLQDRLTNPATASNEAYDNLKAYLLLTTETVRLGDDEKNQKFLSQHLGRLVDEKNSALMMPHIEYFAKGFAEALSDSLAQPFAADVRVIAFARSYAGRLDVHGIYENLKRQIGGLPPYTFPNQVFLGGSQVRGVFTADGYKTLDQLVEGGEFLNIGDEAKWVLGLEAEQMSGAVQNLSQVGDSLRGMYLREYAAEWWNYLTGLRIAPFENLSDAANRVRMLSDARYSPIRKLLEDVARNTTFESSFKKGLREKVGGGIVSMPYIQSEFRDLHRFVQSDPDKGKLGEIDGLLSQLGKVSDELEFLNSAPPREAKVHAANAYTGSGPLAEALREVRRSFKAKDDKTRRAMSALFEQPIRYSWKALLDKSMEYFNDQWSREVFDAYHQLAGYFPFDANGQDAPLSEVAAVFADNGKLWKFVDNELRPFVDETQGWDPKPWEGVEGIALSPAAKNGLTQASVFKASLFRGADPGMKVDVKLGTPVEPDGATKVDKVCMRIGAKDQCWVLEDEKPPAFVFDWPGDGGASIRLVEARGKVLGIFGSSEDKVFDEKSFDGGWGLFRLVAAAAKSPGAGRAEVRCKWTFREGIVVPCVIKTDKGFNNPLARNIGIGLPEKLN